MAEGLCACGNAVRRFTASISRSLSIARIHTSSRNHERRKPRPLAQLLAPMAAAVMQARHGRLRRPMAAELMAIERLLECRVPFSTMTLGSPLMTTLI